jgi:hypothetical protein
MAFAIPAGAGDAGAAAVEKRLNLMILMVAAKRKFRLSKK